ncbi:MAG: stage III sporulation protein AE [Oscillospiraceae bacterium]
MKHILLCLALCLLLTAPAHAADLPDALRRAVPPEAADLLREAEEGDWTGGVSALLQGGRRAVGQIVRERLQNIVLILLVVLLCGVVDGFFAGADAKTVTNYTSMAGALSITLLSAGSMESLIGLGAQTMESLSFFSKALLPTLAAATAASGGVGRAAVLQVLTVFFVDLLLSLVTGLLLPLLYLYIGALTAGVLLPGNVLEGVAEGIKKIITWLLTGALLCFTAYLTFSNVIAGATDGMAVKATKLALSTAVPVVGSILSEASATVLAGAGLLKNTIGVFGMLAVLATCLLPFLQLGIQYLLYKLAALASSTVGAPQLVKLLSGLGGAFGLVLGMTGACALLVTISILSSVAAVTP